MSNEISLEAINSAANFIQSQTTHRPTIALVLGSGLGAVADAVEDAVIIPYRTIPHFPQSTVEGHAGRLVIGQLQGKTVLVMQGRVHYYEGHSMQAITMPIRVMHQLGITTLVVTNAAGGLNPTFKAGELMLITDHINMTGLAGHNPLRGPNLDEFGVRFPSMVTPYDLDLQYLAHQVAKETGVALQEGVYANVAGPSFETPAEVRFLRLIGADAVGMSTAPEVVVANHSGMRVLGISGVSNVAITTPNKEQQTTHIEVLEGTQKLSANLIKLLRGILAKI